MSELVKAWRDMAPDAGGAPIYTAWPHDRAHYFFSRTGWNPDDLGICVAKLVIGLLVPHGEPVKILLDDILSAGGGRRSGARRGSMTDPRRDLRKQASRSSAE